jgi:hypothetical protein
MRPEAATHVGRGLTAHVALKQHLQSELAPFAPYA